MTDLNDAADAKAIFAPLWKRKWLILVVGLLAGALTYVYYKHQDPVYGASTGVYLGSGPEVQELLSESAVSATGNDRSIANQVLLINSSVVAFAVQRKLLAEHKVEAARGSAVAESSEGRDFIQITSRAGSGAAAATLANTYAQVYLKLREKSQRENVRIALESTREQLRTTEENAALGETQTLQVQNLVDRINRLESQLSLSDAGNRQINPAVAGAEPLSPKPTRNAIFAFVLGIVLASIVTYALSRFDRRLRSLSDIEATFQAPVLAAVSSIRHPIVATDGGPVPASALREPMRRLHTTLQLRGISDDIDQRPAPRTVLFISADAGDGKSTLVAGLGLVQAEAGERVAIVESDLRRPIQAELLGVDGSQGLAEVLDGALTMREAIQPVRFAAGPPPVEEPGPGVSTVVESRVVGSISVLPSGGTVANPPALLAGRPMAMLLSSMAEEYDYLLVDAPPPLEVSDVLPVLAMVDAVVLVARVGHTGETSARRLVQLLSRAPHGPVLGIIANDASTADMEAFGFSLLTGDSGGPMIRRG
jgi:Mrp family chromosome partitioning ATPase/capsular polysaccharide biosynthesis protein